MSHGTSKTRKGGYGHVWTFSTLCSYLYLYFYLKRGNSWFQRLPNVWHTSVMQLQDESSQPFWMQSLESGLGTQSMRECFSCLPRTSFLAFLFLYAYVLPLIEEIWGKNLCALCCICLLPAVRNYVDWSPILPLIGTVWEKGWNIWPELQYSMPKSMCWLSQHLPRRSMFSR